MAIDALLTEASIGLQLESGGSFLEIETSSVPPQAAAVGYNTLTFSTTAFSTANVDASLTYASGFQWYLFNFFGSDSTNANNSFPGDGSMVVGQGDNTYNACICSAGAIDDDPTYVGTSFGGGAYFEGVLHFTGGAFDNTDGFPAWWSFALETLAPLAGSQWPGQAPGYQHYSELDFMEYFGDSGEAPLTTFEVTTNDWYGPDPQTRISDQTAYDVGSSGFFSSYHKYGCLWVLATPSTDGYIAYYLDDVLVFTTTYEQYTNQAPPPGSAPWTYGIVDQDHMSLIVGSNNTHKVTLQSVKVWQIDASNNLTN